MNDEDGGRLIDGGVEEEEVKEMVSVGDGEEVGRMVVGVGVGTGGIGVGVGVGVAGTGIIG